MDTEVPCSGVSDLPTISPPPGGLPPSSSSDLHLLWLTGPSCDGCTIKAIGETTAGGLEVFLRGEVPGLPRVHLVHRALSLEQGDAFTELFRRAARGELDPYALVVEASVPDDRLGRSAYFSSEGEDEDGQPVSIGTWLDRLASRALVVIAWGDCGVFGGPHSEAPNPSGATGAWMRLGRRYRSALGLPVINLPGCAPEPIVLQTLTAVLRWAQGDGPPLELDDLNRPRAFYAARAVPPGG